MEINDGELRTFVDRIERLEAEKSQLGEDIRAIYAESKSVGYDPKIIRKVIALRKMDRDARREMEELIEAYMAALGDYSSTPLGVSSIELARHAQ